MRLTHNYKNNATLQGLRLMLGQSIVAFIDRHKETVEALVRSGSPFGGNWLPVMQESTEGKFGTKNGDELVYVHQQVKTLDRTVALLNDRVEELATQLCAGEKYTLSSPSVRSAKACQNEIGINRYRALQQKP